jgi:hypothetical protein
LTPVTSAIFTFLTRKSPSFELPYTLIRVNAQSKTRQSYRESLY